jgi:hypothetical protein
MAGARSLLLNALAQGDVDMNFHKLLNLDTSNLSISGLPPDVTPPAHNFLTGWLRGPQTWSFAQPAFTDLSGNLSVAQQQAIVHVGTIIDGTWNGVQIAPGFLPTLDLITRPAGNVNMALNRLINLADPVSNQDAVTLGFFNSIAPGLNVHAPVAAATTTSNLLAGLTPVDGYTPLAGDRILVKNQAVSRHFQNGVYVASAAAWTRATDMNDGTNSFTRAYVLVLNGTTNGGTAWVQVTPPPVDIVGPDVGTEPSFVQFTPKQATINAGPGLQKTGNTISAVGTPNRIAIGTGIDIDAAYVGQPSITTLGTIAAGVWQGGVIGSAFGGTGNNNPGTISLIGNFSTNVPIGPVFAYNLIFRLNNNTDVTLPLSGVLATLAGTETFSNKSIDAGQITGLLGLIHGGTGGNSQPTAANNILPVQGPGTIGKTLKSDGTNVYWG